MVALGSKMAPPQRVLSSNYRNSWKILKFFLLRTHLPKMLEIRYVTLPNGPFPSLFKPRYQSPKLPRASGVLCSNRRNIWENMKNTFCFRTPWRRRLKSGIEHIRALFLKWWPQGTTKLCCTGLVVRTLKLKRFRVILALLFFS